MPHFEIYLFVDEENNMENTQPLCQKQNSI